MIVCGIDFEATDKDPKTARITEIGAVLFESDGWKPIQGLTLLVYDPSYPPLSDEVIDVTGITDEMLKQDGQPPVQALETLAAFISQPDKPPVEKMIAYNIEYDGTLYACERRRLASPTIPELPREKWLCAYQGVPWEAKYRCRQMSHLALDHGIHVNPDDLHRAIGDVKLMGELLRTRGETVEGMIAYAALPWVVLGAKTTPPWEDGGASTGLAKARGYSFETCRGTDGPRFKKTWVKRVKADQVEKERAEAPFQVDVLG